MSGLVCARVRACVRACLHLRVCACVCGHCAGMGSYLDERLMRSWSHDLSLLMKERVRWNRCLVIGCERVQQIRTMAPRSCATAASSAASENSLAVAPRQAVSVPYPRAAKTPGSTPIAL